MFQNYPPIAFHDLCVFCLTSNTSDEVAQYMTLLNNVCEQLGALTHPEFPANYVVKLHQGVRWCTDLIKLANQAVMGVCESSHNIPTSPVTASSLETGTMACQMGMPYDDLMKSMPNPLEGMDLSDFFFDPDNFFAGQFRMS
jgi:hypothetical protein